MQVPPGSRLSQADLQPIFESNPFPFLEDCAEKYGNIFTLDLGTNGCNDVNANGLWHFLWGAEYVRKLDQFNHADVDQATAATIVSRNAVRESRLVYFPKDEAEQCVRLVKPLDSGIYREQGLLFYNRAFRLACQNKIANSGNKLSTELCSTFMKKIFFEASFEYIFRGFTSNSTQNKPVTTETLDALYQQLVVDKSFRGKVKNPKLEYTRSLELLIQEIESRITALKKPGSTSPAQNQLDQILEQYLEQDVGDSTLIANYVLTSFIRVANTGSTASQWLCYWLAQHPQHIEIIRNEFRGYIQSAETGQQAPGRYDELKFTEAYVREVLRISPMQFNGGSVIAKNHLEIDGFQITRGSMICAVPYLTHRDSNTYARPNEFEPQRFLDKLYPEYSLLPAGLESFTCIIPLDFITYATVSLGHLLNAFDIEPIQFDMNPTSMGLVLFAPSQQNKIRWQGRK